MMTPTSTFAASMLMCIGVFFYASAYGVKDAYAPMANPSTLMLASGTMLVIYSITIKLSLQQQGIPWFDLGWRDAPLSYKLGVLGFGALIVLGDIFFLKGISFPLVSTTMAMCVFALLPVFEGLLQSFSKNASKVMHPGQIVCCAVIVGAIIVYALLEKAPAK